jgi:glycosyltransferase involved in cell wall biosynthesis
VAKILQVCNTNFYLSRFLKPLVQELVDQGHEVECVCEGEVADKAEFGPGVRFHAFAFPRTGSPLQFAGAVARMSRLIRNGRYDCVDSHNRNSSIVGRIAAWRARVPVNLYTAHGFYFHDDQSALARRATIFLESALSRITDFTLSQSRDDTDYAVSSGMIVADRILHVGNGIDVERFSPRHERRTLEAKLALPSGRFRVCSTGRLVQGKGFGDLLEAFALFHEEVPGSELLLIGGNIDQDISPFQQEFEQRIDALGLRESVKVTGLTDRVEDYLGTADVFVLPSYREGLPRALLEAMAMGLCCAATDIRGCREAIDDGQAGLLFPPRDITSLTSLLRKLHAEPGLRTSLAAAGQARARAEFTEARYVSLQVDAINRLLGTPAHPAPGSTRGRALSSAPAT